MLLIKRVLDVFVYRCCCITFRENSCRSWTLCMTSMILLTVGSKRYYILRIRGYVAHSCCKIAIWKPQFREVPDLLLMMCFRQLSVTQFYVDNKWFPRLSLKKDCNKNETINSDILEQAEPFWIHVSPELHFPQDIVCRAIMKSQGSKPNSRVIGMLTI